MGLNKVKGNMYDFADFTWNPIKGRCSHKCTYCYMHRFWDMMKDDSLRLDEKEFKEFDRDMKKYGDSGHFIFVGSSTDMWLNENPAIWIKKILEHLDKYPDNTYLFQTKNPKAFSAYKLFYDWAINMNIVLGITLETNRYIEEITRAPQPVERAIAFDKNPHSRKMITIEPIIDFDLEELVDMIWTIKPEWVNIGADSGGNKLPEPTREKVLLLASELKKFTKVKYKTNIKRIIT